MIFFSIQLEPSSKGKNETVVLLFKKCGEAFLAFHWW